MTGPERLHRSLLMIHAAGSLFRCLWLPGWPCGRLGCGPLEMASKTICQVCVSDRLHQNGSCALGNPSGEEGPSFFCCASSLPPLQGLWLFSLYPIPTLNSFLLPSLFPRVTPWPGRHPDTGAF